MTQVPDNTNEREEKVSGKVSGEEDAVSSGRKDMGQKKEETNFGYDNGIAKPEAQRQDGENPDATEIEKEWQEQSREKLDETAPDKNKS